jgi:hypothetical protein
MERITVRMSDKLSAAVSQHCKSMGLGVSVWVRGLMEREVGGKEDDPYARILGRLDALEDEVFSSQPRFSIPEVSDGSHP